MSEHNLCAVIPSLIPLIPKTKYTIASSCTNNPKDTVAEFTVDDADPETYREGFVSKCNEPIIVMQNRAFAKTEKIFRALPKLYLTTRPIRLSIIPSNHAEDATFTIRVTFQITEFDAKSDPSFIVVGEIAESMCISTTSMWSHNNIPNELAEIPGEIHLVF